jgi:hypothetical protein
VARIGRLRERQQIRRAAEQALAGRPIEQLLGAPTDSAQHSDTGRIPRPAYPRAVAQAGLGKAPGDPCGPPHGDFAPPRADDMFGGLLKAPWMFRMRATPWYRTRLGAFAFVGAAAAVVLSGVLLVLRTPTTAIETPTTVATTPPTRATQPASSEPTRSNIPPTPENAPPPSPPSAHPLDPEPVTANPEPADEPPRAEPLDPEPAFADPGPPDEPPPAEPVDPEP